MPYVHLLFISTSSIKAVRLTKQPYAVFHLSLQRPAPPRPHHLTLPPLVTYRHYATLYFILISTSTESPLGLLDLIQVFVESLDRLFQNVCELDLIFNFETLHATLGEMIVGGVVVETSLERVVEGVRGQGKVVKRPIGGSGGSDGGGGNGMRGNAGGRGVWAGR